MTKSLVIISYYDARSSEHLNRLISDLKRSRSEGRFEVAVCVNVEISRPLDLDKEISVFRRENSGFNIGAWQYAFQKSPGFDFYLFLQDECRVNKAGWLKAYLNHTQVPNVGLVGESLVRYRSWAEYADQWPKNARACKRLCRTIGIDPGTSPTSLQALAMGARADVLNRIGGFVQSHEEIAPDSDEKCEAIATEVVTSIRARAHGYRTIQSAWRPFTYFSHDQWKDVRKASEKPAWHAKKLIKSSIDFFDSRIFR